MAYAPSFRYLTPAFGGPRGASAASLLVPRIPFYGSHLADVMSSGDTHSAIPPAPSFTGLSVPFYGDHLAGDATPAPGAGGGGGGAGSANVDYTHDPILLKVQALTKQQIADAEAASLSAQRTNLIRYGDPKLVDQILGKGSQDTRQAAKDNTFSTVAELKRWNDRAQVGLDEDYNNQNLFYSTARLRGKALQSEDYQRQQSKTAAQLQDALAQIAQNLLAAKQQAQNAELQAEDEAYMRALNAAAAQQYYDALSAQANGSAPNPNPGSGGGGGGGGGGSSALPIPSPYSAPPTPFYGSHLGGWA